MVGGGAANAANNVAALGGRARLAGLVGADPEGKRLLHSLHRGVGSIGGRAGATVPNAGQDADPRCGVHAARQQVVRIDREPDWPVDEAVRPRRSSRN
jgi:D-beta-D-heptose 7-phosphate kinase/D-beta-D-heptose 1-phosphate adenosyltransferase